MLGTLEESDMIRVSEFWPKPCFQILKSEPLMPAESEAGWRVQFLDPGRTQTAQKHLLIIPLSHSFHVEKAQPSGENWEYPEFGCDISPVPRKNSTISVLRKPKPSDLLVGRLCAFKKEQVCIYMDVSAHFSEAPSGWPICHPIFCPDLLHNSRGKVAPESLHNRKAHSTQWHLCPIQPLHSRKSHIKIWPARLTNVVVGFIRLRLVV